MGNDAALAVMLWKASNFTTNAAQVTNPPIDSIREEVIGAGMLHRARAQLLGTSLSTPIASASSVISNDELTAGQHGLSGLAVRYYLSADFGRYIAGFARGYSA